MRQHELSPAPGSRHKRKVIGRGIGSGHGTTSGRGTKGQKSRAGGSIHPRFEGGQLPLIKRLPRKRGFTNIFRTEYAVVNLDRLGLFNENVVVTPEQLVAAGLVKSLRKPIKILGQGEVQRPLLVRANKFSQAAKRKIEAAGGRAEEI